MRNLGRRYIDVPTLNVMSSLSPMSDYPELVGTPTDSNANLKSTVHQAPKLFNDLLLPLSPSNSHVPPLIHPRLPVTRVRVHHHTASFLQYHPTSANIPSPAAGFPVDIQTSTSNATQIQCRTTETPQAVNHTATGFFCRSQLLESFALYFEIVPAAVAAPFYGYQTAVQRVQWRGWT